MKKLLAILLVCISLSGFAQRYTPILKSDVIKNTQYFIWRGDTIDFSQLEGYLFKGDSLTLYVTPKALMDSISGLPGGHDAITLDATALTAGLSLDGQKILSQAAQSNQNGYLRYEDWIKFNNSLQVVTHDNSLKGNGTESFPLEVDSSKVALKEWTINNFITREALDFDSLKNAPVIPVISNIPYGESWNGNLDGATKNAIYSALQSLGGHDAVTLNVDAQTAGLSLNGQEISFQKATASKNGYLSKEDWTTFNDKADRSELHEHSNKTILDNISQTDIDNWNNDEKLTDNDIANFGYIKTDTKLTQEEVEDYVAGLLTAGSNITLNYNDTNGTLTINSIGGATLTQEEVQDFISGMFSNNGVLSANYDDAGNAIVLTVNTNLSEYVNNAGFLTSIPDEYLTESEGDGRYKGVSWFPDTTEVVGLQEFVFNNSKGATLDIPCHNVRYVREYISEFMYSESIYQQGYWQEIEVYDDGVNVALNKSVSAVDVNNVEFTQSVWNLNKAVNGTLGENSKATISTSNHKPAAIKIDLGQSYTIDSIKVWHYNVTNSNFKAIGLKLQISEDDVTWTTIYDSSVDGEYTEMAEGKTHSIDQDCGSTVDFAQYVTHNFLTNKNYAQQSWVQNNYQSKLIGNESIFDGWDKDVSDDVTLSQLNNKVDKETGKGLSKNDYTDADKTKLLGLDANAEENVNADWTATSGDAQILNKPTKLSDFTNDIGAGSGGSNYTFSTSNFNNNNNDISVKVGGIYATNLNSNIISGQYEMANPLQDSHMLLLHQEVPVNTNLRKITLLQLKNYIGTTGGGGSGSSYTLPVASSTTLGGIKVGSGLTIDGAGVLNATGSTVDLSNYYNKSEVDNKVITSSERSKLQGIQAGAEQNVNADWDATSGDAQILNKPTKLSDFENDIGVGGTVDLSNYYTKSEVDNKVITGAERTKLSNIEAEADKYGAWILNVNGTAAQYVKSRYSTGENTLNFKGENAIQATYDDANNTVVYSLKGDISTPGNSRYYGTNNAGVHGWYALPTPQSGSIDYINNASFANGTLTLSGMGNAGASVSLDGRYKLDSYVPSWNEITGKPTLFSGDYEDLTNKPTKLSDFTNDIGAGGTVDLSDYYDKGETNNLLNDKVDKVSGKGLSTNDYTTAEKTKLSNLNANAEENVNADWTATSGDAQILNKPTKLSDFTNDIGAGGSYTLMPATPTTLGGVKTGNGIVIDADGTIHVSSIDYYTKPQADATFKAEGWQPSWNSDITDIPADFSDGVDNVNDSDYDSSNEIQELSKSGKVISLSKGGGSINISDVLESRSVIRATHDFGFANGAACVGESSNIMYFRYGNGIMKFDALTNVINEIEPNGNSKLPDSYGSNMIYAMNRLFIYGSNITQNSKVLVIYNLTDNTVTTKSVNIEKMSPGMFLYSNFEYDASNNIDYISYQITVIGGGNGSQGNYTNSFKYSFTDHPNTGNPDNGTITEVQNSSIPFSYFSGYTEDADYYYLVGGRSGNLYNSSHIDKIRRIPKIDLTTINNVATISEVSNAVAKVHDGYLTWLCGMVPNGTAINAVNALKLSNNTIETFPALLSVRKLHSGVFYNNKMYLLGGKNNNSGGGIDTYVRTVESYELPASSNTFTQSDADARYLKLTGGTLTGDLTAPNFILNSDRTLKENIRKIDTKIDIDFKQFNFKGNKQKRYGVIAQEVQKTHPELVTKDANGKLGVSYIDLLILKIAELEKRIKELENEK